MKTEQWPTKAEAAIRAGVSIRTIERRIKAGAIEARQVEDELRCNPADLIETMKPPMMMPAMMQPTDATPTTPASNPVASLVELLAAIIKNRSLPEPKKEPLFLTLQQAEEFTGLSAKHLQEAIKSGILPARRDGRAWKLKRLDLQNL